MKRALATFEGRALEKWPVAHGRSVRYYVPMSEDHGEPRGRRPVPNDGEYLFHVQKPRPNGTGAERAPRVRRSPLSPSQQVFVSNLRILGVVLAVMAVLLFVAVHVAVKTWQIKQARQTKNIVRGDPALTGDHRREIGSREARPEFGGSDRPGPDALQQAQLLTAQGDALRDTGNYELALQFYGKALGLWPGLTQVKAEMGRLYLLTGEPARALGMLRSAAENDPTDPYIMNNLGAAYFYTEEYERATRLFESVLQIDPSFAESCYNVALCHMARGRRKDAREWLERYLEQRPNDPKAIKEKAFLLAASGDYTNAMTLLEKALTFSPSWAPLYFDAGATAALMGDAEHAIRYLTEARSLVSPVAVYAVYQQPAFQEIRRTPAGRAFEGTLVDEARKRAAAGEKLQSVQPAAQPMLSPARAPEPAAEDEQT